MRVVAVVDPIKVNITNYNSTEKINVSNNPTIQNSKKHKMQFLKVL